MSRAASPHNRLIIREANAALKPLGLSQRGGSRSWLDDHGDSVTVVEFVHGAAARQDRRSDRGGDAVSLDARFSGGDGRPLAALPLLDRSEHRLYNAAIAGALAGRWDVARSLAAKIEACAYGAPKFRDPVIALHALAQSVLDDPAAPRSKLDAIVERSRTALKLPPRRE